jgi:hypothetical protein
MSNDTTSRGTSLFPGLSYAEAVARVLADIATRYSLRDRIREDLARDPVDCVADADILLALNELRMNETLARARAHEVH